MAEGRKAGVIVGLTMRYLLTTRRGLVTAALAAVPLILAASLAASRVQTFNIVLFQQLMVPLFLQVVLIFVTLVQTTALIREEIDDTTLPYLLTRPIPKPALLVWKYVGYLASVLLLLLPPLILAYAITQAYAGDPLGADLDVLGAFLVTAVLGAAAYGAFFTLLSVVVRRPLALGLLFGFIWESFISRVPGDVPKLSITHYLQSILKGMIPLGPLAGYLTDLSAGTAAAVLIGFTIAALALSIFAFQQMEFKQKA